jgi:hypothetical protein
VATAATTCQSLRTCFPSAPDGNYWINPTGLNPVLVFCRHDVTGGGWALVTRASDTNGLPDYEFRAAMGTARSHLQTTFSQGLSSDDQYLMGVESVLDPRAVAVELLYVCYNRANRAGTEFWQQVSAIPRETLRSDLLTANGPPGATVVTGVSALNRLGNVSTGNWYLHPRDPNLSADNVCGNWGGGQSGFKASCPQSGQSVLNPPGVWVLTHQPGVTLSDGVTSCGMSASSTLYNWAGEIYVRAAATGCAAGATALTAAASCQEIRNACPTAANGVFYLNPTGGRIVRAACDFATDNAGGVWTVVARASDTDGSAAVSEFATAVGSTRSVLQPTATIGSPSDPQFVLALNDVLPAGAAELEIQYYCFLSTNRATRYWTRVGRVNRLWLTTALSMTNPQFWMTKLPFENLDGSSSSSSMWAFQHRGTSGISSCGNTAYGQSGLKVACTHGQTPATPRNVWFLTHGATSHTEVTSCGATATNVMAYYVGEVRVRATARPAVCSVGATASTPGFTCASILANCPTAPTGLYYIAPNGGRVVLVRCDMDIRSGGWALATRVSDTDASANYEFSSAIGATRSALQVAYSQGSPVDSQYVTALNDTIEPNATQIDLLYRCWAPSDPMSTEYWVEVQALTRASLFTSLQAPNPEVHLTNVKLTNKDGYSTTTGTYSFLPRDVSGTTYCGNSGAGQNGPKFSCIAGQTAPSAPQHTIWFLTHYTGGYTEVSQCGPGAVGSLNNYYVGEIYVRGR